MLLRSRLPGFFFFALIVYICGREAIHDEFLLAEPCKCVISERFRDKELIIKRYINSPSLLLLLLSVTC